MVEQLESTPNYETTDNPLVNEKNVVSFIPKKVLFKSVTSVSKLDSDLNNQLTDIESNTSFWKQVDHLVQNVAQDKDLEDPQHPSKIEWFISAIKAWHISEAISIAFSFLKWVMWPGTGPEGTFWFKDNREVHDFILWLSQNVDHLSIAELESQKNNLANKISSCSWVKRKIGLTYALSRLLDEIIYKKDTSKLWMRWSSDDFSTSKSTNECIIARMAQQVQPGDILAINKSEKKTGDKLLTELTDDDLDTSHVLIVTHVDTNAGTITVAHSTTSKLNSKGSWVETNVSFAEYADRFSALAIATLRPPEWVASTLVQNVLAKDGKWYDKLAAASTALLWWNPVQNNNKYNCVELIAQSFPDSISSTWKSWTHPSEMLQTMNPVYVTIAWKSMGWS